MDENAPLGKGHQAFLTALQKEDVVFGDTTPVDEPSVHRHEGLVLWSLVAQDARYEPGRDAYYDELYRAGKARRLREMAERARRAPRNVNRLTLVEALELLEGVRSRGPHKWSARCPIHEDNSPSLLISESTVYPGEPSIHCFAGCSFVDIVRYLKACR